MSILNKIADLCHIGLEGNAVEALEAIEALLINGAWQPIETAPKDEWLLIGTWVNDEWVYGRSMHFLADDEDFNGNPCNYMTWASDYIDMEEPSHWMPLPAPPIKEEQ